VNSCVVRVSTAWGERMLASCSARRRRKIPLRKSLERCTEVEKERTHPPSLSGCRMWKPKNLVGFCSNAPSVCQANSPRLCEILCADFPRASLYTCSLKVKKDPIAKLRFNLLLWDCT
jgi:hypothetical protein